MCLITTSHPVEDGGIATGGEQPQLNSDDFSDSWGRVSSQVGFSDMPDLEDVTFPNVSGSFLCPMDVPFPRLRHTICSLD